MSNQQHIQSLIAQARHPSHSGVVVTRDLEVFNAAARGQDVEAAIKKPDQDIAARFKELLVDLWNSKMRPTQIRIMLEVLFGEENEIKIGGHEGLNTALTQFFAAHAMAFKLASGHRDVVVHAVAASIEPGLVSQPGAPVLARSFFQPAFSWKDQAGESHLVKPEDRIYSAQGTIIPIETNDLNTHRPLISLVACPVA